MEAPNTPSDLFDALERTARQINEAAQQISSVFGVSMGEVADGLQRFTDGGRFIWHQAPNLWSLPDPNQNERARELLLSLLDDKQQAMYEQYKCFVAVGSKTGDHYLIYTANNYNIYNISTGYKFCAVPSNGVPPCDMLASQLLMIECEEETFLAVANRGGYWKPKTFFQWIGLPFTLSQKLIADAPRQGVPKPSATRAVWMGGQGGGRYATGVRVMQGYTSGIRDGPYATATTDGWQDCGNPDCAICREQRGKEYHRLRMEELIAISGDVNAPYEARRQAADELRRM